MPRILIVEDNDLSRDALSRRLERRGFEISVATNGIDALVVANDARPDLILMDLGLPGIDGWEATRHLKGDPVTAHIPIIVLSAHAMASDRNTALSAGGDDFDAKPIRFDRLLAKIDTLLTRSQEPTASR